MANMRGFGGFAATSNWKNDPRVLISKFPVGE
jgi:hypothetical protein